MLAKAGKRHGVPSLEVFGTVPLTALTSGDQAPLPRASVSQTFFPHLPTDRCQSFAVPFITPGAKRGSQPCLSSAKADACECFSVGLGSQLLLLRLCASVPGLTSCVSNSSTGTLAGNTILGLGPSPEQMTQPGPRWSPDLSQGAWLRRGQNGKWLQRKRPFGPFLHF